MFHVHLKCKLEQLPGPKSLNLLLKPLQCHETETAQPTVCPELMKLETDVKHISMQMITPDCARAAAMESVSEPVESAEARAAALEYEPKLEAPVSAVDVA